MHRRLWTGIATLVTLATLAASSANADENHVRGERRARGAPAPLPSSRAPSNTQRALGNPHFTPSPRTGASLAPRLSSGNVVQGQRHSPFAGQVPSTTRGFSSPTLTPSPYAGRSQYTPAPRFQGSSSTDAFGRLRSRPVDQGLSTQFGAAAGVRRSRDASPLGDTRLSQPGFRSAGSGRSAPAVGFRRSGQVASDAIPGTTPAPVLRSSRSGSVQYGGGAAALTRRQGVVSYGGSHPLAGSHAGHHHSGYGHAGYRVRSSWRSSPPWWWYRGPRYGFGFGVGSYYSSYDPWPWYDTWGFATVYEPVPVYVPVYVPQEAPPTYVLPGQPYPPDLVDPGLYPQGTVPPPAGAPLPPPALDEAPAPEDGVAPPMDEATRQALEQAFDLFRGRDYAGAYARLDALVGAHPELGEAWMGRFYAAFPLGRYADAAVSLGRAAALGAFPRGYRFDPRPLYDAPSDAQKPFDTHFARLAGHVNANPSDPNGYAVLAYLYVALGRTTEAEAALASLRALRPADPLALVLRTAMLPAEEPPAAPGQPMTPGQQPMPQGQPGFPPPSPYPPR